MASWRNYTERARKQYKSGLHSHLDDTAGESLAHAHSKLKEKLAGEKKCANGCGKLGVAHHDRKIYCKDCVSYVPKSARRMTPPLARSQKHGRWDR
jgi:hypothetical protein